jgi:hypothetical protein
MANRFVNPFPQFFNSTPQVLSGAKLFFYTGEMSCDTQAKPRGITSSVIAGAGR